MDNISRTTLSGDGLASALEKMKVARDVARQNNQKALESHKPPKMFPQFFENEAEENTFSELYKRWRAQTEKHPSYAKIPRFYFGAQPTATGLPGPSNALNQFDNNFSDTLDRSSPQHHSQELLADLTHQYHQLKQHENAITNYELQLVWECIQKAAENGTHLNYEQFKDCEHMVKEHTDKFEPFFTPEVFLSLCKESQNKISTDHLLDLIMYVVNWRQRYLTLCQYSDESGAYITEDRLRQYILDQSREMPRLQTLVPSFLETYLEYATRKFVFLHSCQNKKVARKPPMENLFGNCKH